MPFYQDVKGSHSEGQTRSEIFPDSVSHFLKMTDIRQHRQHSFHYHPHVPSSSLADFHVRWVSSFGVEAAIRQDNHLTIELFNQWLEGRVMHTCTLAVSQPQSTTIPLPH